MSGAANITVSAIFHGDYYTEGPAIDSEGNMYFTTLKGGKIIRIDTQNRTSVWAKSSCPNGQRILANGDHLICDSVLKKVIRFDASGKKIKDAASGYCEDLMIRTPNDLTVDDEAGFYFTDSVRNNGAVHFFGKTGAGKVVARDLDYPNGICLSRDKRSLFVAESYKNRILVFLLSEPGIVQGEPEVFCILPSNPKDPVTGNLPDGIILDSSENLWVAHYGTGKLHVVSPRGEVLNSWQTGIPLTSNICFVNDGKLIVTGGASEPGPGYVHMLTFSKPERRTKPYAH